MTDTRDWADDAADELIKAWLNDENDDGAAVGRHEEAVARALRDAARVQPGHVRTDDGTERKVLGTLPVTADGCVVVPGEEVYHPEQDPHFALCVVAAPPWDADDNEAWPLPEDCDWVASYSYWEHDTGYSQYETRDVRTCYSTRAAAEAAKTGGG